MLLTEVDTSIEEYSFLDILLQNRENILQNFFENRGSLSFGYGGWVERGKIPGWKIYIVSSIEENENLQFFPHLNSFITNLPENVKLCGIAFSESKNTMAKDTWHVENLNEYSGFRRYHVPLQIPETSHLKFISGSMPAELDTPVLFQWEVGKVYHFEGLDNYHCVEHGESEETRLNLIVDVLQDTEYTEAEIATTLQEIFEYSYRGVVFDEN